MGRAANATIFYGYCPAEEAMPWDIGKDPGDWEDEADPGGRFWDILAQKGVEKPDPPLRSEISSVDEFRSKANEWNRQVDEIKEQYNYCEIISWGDLEYDSTSYLIAVPESIKTADWGDPLLLPGGKIPDLKWIESWDYRLSSFCELMGIPEDTIGARGWWAAVSYG